MKANETEAFARLPLKYVPVSHGIALLVIKGVSKAAILVSEGAPRQSSSFVLGHDSEYRNVVRVWCQGDCCKRLTAQEKKLLAQALKKHRVGRLFLRNPSGPFLGQVQCEEIEYLTKNLLEVRRDSNLALVQEFFCEV